MSDSIVADIPMNVKPVINIKNCGFRFVKFKSNGTKAKRPLEQIQKTQGAKKKKTIILVFLGGFAWIFSEIKRGRIFPEIKWGMDFLGN